MTLIFRNAEPSDIELLLVMMRELYLNDGIAFNEQRSRRATLQLMDEPRAGTIRVIEVGEAVAGYMVLTFGFSLEHGGWHGFIDELFVNAPHRGAGLGTAAVRHLEFECARLGMTALLLEADLANEKTTRLYQRLGFREHSRRLMMLPVAASGTFIG